MKSSIVYTVMIMVFALGCSSITGNVIGFNTIEQYDNYLVSTTEDVSTINNMINNWNSQYFNAISDNELNFDEELSLRTEVNNYITQYHKTMSELNKFQIFVEENKNILKLSGVDVDAIQEKISNDIERVKNSRSIMLSAAIDLLDYQGIKKESSIMVQNLIGLG